MDKLPFGLNKSIIIGIPEKTRLISFLSVIFILILLIILTTPTYFSADSFSVEKSRLKPLQYQLEEISFIDKTLESGLTLVHQQGTSVLKGLNETLGSGACVLDFDNDGWMDLYVVNGSGQTRFYGQHHWWNQPRSSTLYKNNQDGKFEDVTKISGLNQRVWGMGCAVADFDNDGDQDLLTINIGKNEFFNNNGDGTFTNVTINTGITGDVWSTSASIADYDRDGLLDIYIVNYINYNKNARTFEKNKGFKETTSPFFNAALYESLPNKLYKNLGGLHFKDVTQKTGVQNFSGRSLSSLWLDINNDLWPDLYVTNDEGLPDVVYINQGNGTFKISEKNYKQNAVNSSRNVNAGDIDNDGDLDLFISRVIGEAPSILINGETPIDKVSSKRIKSHQLIDLSREMGVATEQTRSYSGWGSGFHDFNNDGWLDLFVVNGLNTPNPDAPGITTGQEKLVWINEQGSGFRRVKDSPILRNKQSGRGVVFADFDNDGDVDVYATHNNDLGQLLINGLNSNNHWLGLKLYSDHFNKDSIGAKVWLKTDSKKQYREVGSNHNYMSQSDRRLHFGLANDTNNTELKILWPSGRYQEIKNLPFDKYIEIVEGQNEPKHYSYPVLEKKQLLPPIHHIRIPENRLKYLEWISEVYPEKLSEQLKFTLLDNESKIRLAAIKFIQQHKSSENLELLVSTFQNELDVPTILASVDAIKGYEDEHSVKWLLPLLEKDNYEIQCAVANAFSFFFQEEEAVIIRKYIALPHLIAMLEHSSAKTRECAALALGEAERYRGLIPLTQLLDDPVEKVKIAAIKSLGRIREKEAISYLLQLIENDNQSIEVMSHIIIALKRLNYKKLDEVLSIPFLNNHSNEDLMVFNRHLEIIKEIQDNKTDGVVIDQDHLVHAVSKWFVNNVGIKTEVAKHELLITNAIDILKNNNNEQVTLIIKKLIKHPKVVVREKAYSFLISNSLQHEAIRYAKLALKYDESAVRIKALKILLQRSVTLLNDQIVSYLKTKDEKLFAIPLLTIDKDKTGIKQLLKWINDSSEEIEVRTAAIKELSAKILTAELPLINIDPMEKDYDFISLLYRYQFKFISKYPFIDKIPEFIETGIELENESILKEIIVGLTTRKEAWAQKILREILLDNKLPDHLKELLIFKLGKINQEYANNLLYSYAKLRHQPLSAEAIKQLRSTNKRINNFLWRIIRNQNENEEIRFAAANQLFPSNKKNVIDELNSFYTETNIKGQLRH